MIIIERILLNIIYIVFPMLLYQFYMAHNNNMGKKTNQIILDLCLFTSLYLTITYGKDVIFTKSIMLLNIPLIICFLRDRKEYAFIMSFVIAVNYHLTVNFNIFLTLTEYFLYFIFYSLILNKRLSKDKLIASFTLIKTFILTIEAFYIIPNTLDIKITFINLLITSAVFYFMTYIILFLIDETNNIIDININLKAMEKEKKLRNSLFNITHEVKNPIAVCKGYLDMFDFHNPAHEKYVSIIKQEIDRTLILLNDFLSFTKIKIEKDIIDINLLLEDIYDNFSILLNCNIDVDFKITDDEIYLVADYNRIKQVLINVIKNSMEALEGVKNKRIGVYTRKNKRYLDIIVEDNGIGMTKETLEKIREPFYTTKKNGTGLGISISREVIELHNGEIIYESELNVGTKVIIRLPFDAS